MPNIDVLDKAIEAIRRNPAQHDQSSFISAPTAEWEIQVYADSKADPECGTTLCMAGWISFLNAPAGTKFSKGGYLHIPDNDRGVHAEEFARETADLTSGQVDALFYDADTLKHLEAMVNHLRENPKAGEAELDAVAGI